jgi:cell division protein FtsB
MIKVNLLRNVGVTAGGGAGGDQQASAISLSPSANKAAGGRVAVILLLPLALYTYDWIANSALETEFAEVRTKLESVKAERAKFGDTGVRMEQYTKEKKELDEKVDAIREVARNRLREVKSLDALQSLVPSRTWLNKVDIKGNLVRITGLTSSDEGITELIRGLESSSFFSRVEPKSTSQEMLGTVSVKKFDLEFRVGKVQE